MKHLVLASTSYQLLCLAAAADAGVFAGGETVLVLADGSQMPELTTPLPEVAGYERLVARFDRVVDLGGLLLPRRPVQFSPRTEDLSLWENLLRQCWELGEERITLWLDAIQVNPGTALARIFFDAVLNAHADGLMAYGPTRNVLPLALQQRVEAVLYLDLVPGLAPMMLDECGPRLVPLDSSGLARVIAETEDGAAAAEVEAVRRLVGDHPAPRVGLLLGQYLSRLELLSTAEEEALHQQMVQLAAEEGITHCVFKPHPAAGPAQADLLASHAASLDLELLVLDSPVQAELLFTALRPSLVLSAFSTGLATASAVFGLPVRAVGTALLLDRLAPYENSNRVPLTLVDALYARSSSSPTVSSSPATTSAPAAEPPLRSPLQELLVAVCYCMQPENLAARRGRAEAFLTDVVTAGERDVGESGERAAGAGASDGGEMRYFKRRRLTALALPGSLAPSVRSSQGLRRVLRGGRRRAGRAGRLLAQVPRALASG